jgi:ribosomal protein S18
MAAAIPTVGRGMLGSAGALGAAGITSSMIGSSLSEFSVMNKPWNEYMKYVPRQDSEPLQTPLNPKPMYKGRKVGKEGWLFHERVQLHYKRYPDEGITSNVSRWRYGDTIGDVDLQQFKNAQPHILDREDEQGFKAPPPEVYMKLNHKNPAVLSRFLTRTGHYYPQDVLPLNPEAVKLHRLALARARRIGLYPKFGNPYWFRVQQHRPKLVESMYDPITSSIKSTSEHFAFNWLQLHRIKTYFAQAEKRQGSSRQQKTITKQMAEPTGEQSPYESRAVLTGYYPSDIENAPKVTTVPGLMSNKGLRKNMNLYSRSSKKRMGFPNPLGTTLKI